MKNTAGSGPFIPIRRKCLAVLMIALLVLQPAKKAAGGDTLAELSALAAALTALMAQYEIDMAQRTKVWTNEKSLHEKDVNELAFDVTSYALDHVGILDSNTVWNDYASKVSALYTDHLYKNPGRQLSFGTDLPQGDFDGRNPGYDRIRDSLDGRTDYPSAYKKAGKDLRDYARNVLEGNRAEIADISDSFDPDKDTKEISRIYDALFGLSMVSPSSSETVSSISGEEGLGDIIAGVLAALPSSILKNLNVTTYRAALQAVNQADNYNNKVLSLLRVDIMRQLEAETQFALYEQQERTGRTAAFEKAVKPWADVNPSSVAY